MRQAPEVLSDQIVTDADAHTFETHPDALSFDASERPTRELFTVHLNDDGTTTLYYTGV